MHLRRPTLVLAMLSLVAASLLVGARPAAGASPICVGIVLNLELPMPGPDEGFEVEHVVNADCTITASAVRLIPASKALADAGVTGQMRKTHFKRIGSTQRHLDPDYHVNSIAWDCCGVQMTRLVTDLTWTEDGTNVTGWNAGGYQAYHAEFTCLGDPDGWYPVTGYLINDIGGTGSTVVGVHSHHEWGYRGFFDLCGGSTFYNVFDNYVRGYGNGSAGCAFSDSIRATKPGFHIVSQCYNPVITIRDDQF